MNISIAKAKKLARTLLRENRKRSWRSIAHEDYQDRINYATLNRFAINKGAWIPKDEKILIALGLKKPREPKLPPPILPEWKKQIKKQIALMAKNTRIELGMTS